MGNFVYKWRPTAKQKLEFKCAMQELELYVANDKILKCDESKFLIGHCNKEPYLLNTLKNVYVTWLGTKEGLKVIIFAPNKKQSENFELYFSNALNKRLEQLYSEMYKDLYVQYMHETGSRKHIVKKLRMIRKYYGFSEI